ncbi:MAG: adenine phosphoribosyltransferase [Alphaproteobacteria bacterium]|nr:adenine phosphoribosyltransferase [Alphaproteobacteria bacterium]
MDLLNHIDIIPDFPKPGINFYDIQSLLKKPEIWVKITDTLADQAKTANADLILGIESRGFLTGLPVAQKLGLPFGMVRKKGKLPGNTIEQSYALEYGTDTIEVQENLIENGMRIAILDDLLATGGTMKATGDLVQKAGGEVVLGACIIELHELGGRDQFNFPLESLFSAPLNPFATVMAG